jgi:hypothetical protein
VINRPLFWGLFLFSTDIKSLDKGFIKARLLSSFQGGFYENPKETDKVNRVADTEFADGNVEVGKHTIVTGEISAHKRNVEETEVVHNVFLKE